MAQHDMVLENSPGAALRSDINAALLALVTCSSGAAEPATTYPFMPWADAANDMMKQRNAANTAWIDLFKLSTGLTALLSPGSLLAGIAAGTTATSNKNILINGEVTRINQRGIAGWSAVAIGSYGYDGWKKVDANNITQIIEAGRFVPSSVYTLSGVGVTTQQVTSPSSGNWTLPSIPNTATNVQLELGAVATSFERRPVEHELISCRRYLRVFNSSTGFPAAGVVYSATHAIVSLGLGEGMRVAPSLTNVSATGVLFFGGFSVNWTTPALQSAASCSIQIDIASSGMTIGQGVTCGAITSGSIILSAELQS